MIDMLRASIFSFVGLLLTLLGFIDGIYSSIDKDERKTFRKIPIFGNPFTLLSFLLLLIGTIVIYFLD
jgi:hypothetical protein